MGNIGIGVDIENIVRFAGREAEETFLKRLFHPERAGLLLFETTARLSPRRPLRR